MPDLACRTDSLHRCVPVAGPRLGSRSVAQYGRSGLLPRGQVKHSAAVTGDRVEATRQGGIG